MGIYKINQMIAKVNLAYDKTEAYLEKLSEQIQLCSDDDVKIVCSYLAGDGIGVGFSGFDSYITIELAIEQIKKGILLDEKFITRNASL